MSVSSQPFGLCVLRIFRGRYLQIGDSICTSLTCRRGSRTDAIGTMHPVQK